MRPLPTRFYNRPTALVAQELVGRRLVRETKGHWHVGRIVETEAYLGIGDLASHAARGLTPRTRSTWGRPGVAYVYRSYGIHWCLNAVTLDREPYGAVLIRAVELEPPGCCGRTFSPADGMGPGKLCGTLSIDGTHNGHSLQEAPLMIVEGKRRAPLVQGPRIGIRRAARRLLRFAEEGNLSVSRPRAGLRRVSDGRAERPTSRT